MSNIFADLVGTIKPFLSKYLVTIVSFLIGIISVFVTPLKEVLLYKVYPERATVQIKANETVSLGNDLNMQIVINSQSPVPITEGDLAIQYDINAFILKEGEMVLKTPTINASEVLPEKGKFVFKAIKIGTYKFYAIFHSKRKLYKDSLMIQVADMSNTNTPNQSNLSGLWKFSLGLMNGQLKLTENDNTLSGTYALDNMDQGTISGIRDGKVLKLSLLNSNNVFRWWIQGEWLPNGNFLELTGDASRYRVRNNGWEVVDTNKLKFYSTHRLAMENQ